MPDTIAERIRALREERGWSKQELARRVGGRNPRTVVQRWEGGDVIPSPASVDRLAGIFGVPSEAVDPSGSAYKTTGPRTKSHDVDNNVEPGRIPPSLPTITAEGLMKNHVDAVLGALGQVDEDQRPAFVAAVKRIAARMVLGLEDAGAMPAKQKRASGHG